LAEQARQPEARVASAQQAARPQGGPDAAAVWLPAADAAPGAEAVPGAGAAPDAEARRALVAWVAAAVLLDAAAEQPWAALGARVVLPSAVALAFRSGRLRSAPAPRPAVRFAHGTTGLQIASP
jgi:hypothetical protein